MPRPKKIRRTVELKIYLPVDVKEALDNRLRSEITGEVPYDSRNILITALVETWLEKGGK